MNEVQIQMQIHWRQTQIQIQPTRIASLKRTTTFGDAAAFIQISSSVLLLAALRELAGKNQFRLFAFFLQKNKKKKTEWNEWKKNKPTCMSPSPLRPTYGWFCWVFVWFLPRLPTTCAPRSPPPPRRHSAPLFANNYVRIWTVRFYFMQKSQHKSHRAEAQAEKSRSTRLRMRNTERDGNCDGRQRGGNIVRWSTCAGVLRLQQGNQHINYKFGSLQLQPGFFVCYMPESLAVNGLLKGLTRWGWSLKFNLN